MNNEVWAPRMSKRKLVWKDVLILFLGNACTRTHTHKQTQTEKSKSKKAKAQTRILPLKETSGQSQLNMLVILRRIYFCNDNRGRHHEMKGNEANRSDDQLGGQKDGMNSEPSWVSFLFSCPRVRWEAVSPLWYGPLTWLCMNLRLIPSSVTCSSPPSPVFMSWTGNSPPSSGPEGNIAWV